MKIIGKPYSGKPNVRFDEGELEIEHVATTPALYSTKLTGIFSQLFLPVICIWATLPSSADFGPKSAGNTDSHYIPYLTNSVGFC